MSLASQVHLGLVWFPCRKKWAWEGQGGQEGSAAIQDKAPELGQLLQGPGGSEWELALGRLQCGKGEPAWGPLSTPGRG